MNVHNTIALVNDETTTVDVEFDKTPDKHYTYRVKKSWGVKVGDNVIVMPHGKPKVATVVGVDTESNICPTTSKRYSFVSGLISDYSKEVEAMNNSELQAVNELQRQQRAALRTKVLDSLGVDQKTLLNIIHGDASV